MRVKTKDKANAKRPARHEGVLLPAGLLSDSRSKIRCDVHRRPSFEVWSTGQIWIVRNFLTPEECNAWINYASSSSSSSSRDVKLEHVQQQGTRCTAARECYRAQCNDAVMAQRLYDRLVEWCAPQLFESIAPYISSSSSLSSSSSHSKEVPVTFNPNIRLYRYDEGMHFAKHYDDSNVVAGVGTTRLTVLIYLTESQGGATRFYTLDSTDNDNDDDRDGIAFQPMVGAMLLHVHGDLCLAHRGDPVLVGTKWVLRTDLVYRYR